MFSNAGKHPWANFFSVVECEDIIGPSLALKRFVGTRLAPYFPTDGQRCLK